MSDLAIKIENVSRTFRRYKHPRYRVLELLGMRPPKHSYDEFQALSNVSFDVKHGERVALIGRNGAGKSTLLSIICGRLRQSSGNVRIHGNVQALMELGTGFHPEFTGKENVLASLAYHGVTGRRAHTLLEEITDFAELEEFIGQPVKTYSAGMYARLAFAAATAIEPEILIIDEVLGAGDAYFASKSTDRMKRLTTESGATVLFVSHDMSSVERLCSRAVWIERGCVRMDDDARAVSKAYYASILEQEETRLRNETARLLARQKKVHAIDSSTVYVQFRLPGNAHVNHFIRKVSVQMSDGKSSELTIGTSNDDDVRNPAFVVRATGEVNAWGAPSSHGGDFVRALDLTTGAQTAAICFQQLNGWRDGPLTVQVEHLGEGTEKIHVELVAGEESFHIGNLSPGTVGAGWQRDALTWAPGGKVADDVSAEQAISQALEEAQTQEPKADHWNTSSGSFTKLATLDRATGEEKSIFGLGEDIVLTARFVLPERVPHFWFVVIAFDANGQRAFLEATHFTSGAARGVHEMRTVISKPNLRQGQYAISIEILPEFRFDWDGPGRLPFVCHIDRGISFKINENYAGTIELGMTRQDVVSSLVNIKTAAESASN